MDIQSVVGSTVGFVDGNIVGSTESLAFDIRMYPLKMIRNVHSEWSVIFDRNLFGRHRG